MELAAADPFGLETRLLQRVHRLPVTLRVVCADLVAVLIAATPVDEKEARRLHAHSDPETGSPADVKISSLPFALCVRMNRSVSLVLIARPPWGHLGTLRDGFPRDARIFGLGDIWGQRALARTEFY